MKIFISYARVDKPYCVRIVETLDVHDVWYDQRLYAGQHWWREIMRRLEWCEVFLYLLSPESVNSMYCKKELDVAMKLKRPIIPILIDAETEIPDYLDDYQYLDMSTALTAGNVAGLLNAILLVEREALRISVSATNTLSTSEMVIPEFNSGPDMIRNAAKAMHEGDYDNAILLLKQAQAGGFESRFVNLENLIEIAEEALATRTRLKEAEREYEYIASLFEYESTRDYACEILRSFQQEYPLYDPKQLYKLCESPHGHTSDIEVDFVDEEVQDAFFLDLLNWCKIPEGRVEISSINTDGEHYGDKSEHVDQFILGQYPVTNGQFDEFINAHDGYKNPQWWNFSKFAKEWFEEVREPQKPRFLGDDRPRETVNWYEAMAFCNWISYRLGMKITLPTIAQWQRAAQGDDDRVYPWGNHYSGQYCNTHESKLKMTTPVTQYPEGVSPYNVYDMAGNVWEWTLDMAEPTDDSPDYKRSVIGGSFVSPCERAQVPFRYYLNPRVRYASIGFRLARVD